MLPLTNCFTLTDHSSDDGTVPDMVDSSFDSNTTDEDEDADSSIHSETTDEEGDVKGKQNGEFVIVHCGSHLVLTLT